jgi:hypothetical protein
MKTDHQSRGNPLASEHQRHRRSKGDAMTGFKIRYEVFVWINLQISLDLIVVKRVTVVFGIKKVILEGPYQVSPPASGLAILFCDAVRDRHQGWIYFAVHTRQPTLLRRIL